MRKQEIGGMAALTLTALIWGLAFVAQVQGMDAMSPMFFNAARFTLGALSLVPILLWTRARARRTGKGAEADAGTKSPDPAASTAKATPATRLRTLLTGCLCGVFLFTASTLQQYGVLIGKSAGRAGFITALYIVMVPLLGLVFLRRRINALTVVSVVLAVAGFYFLCITDGFGSIGLGDVMLFGCAVLFAGHIIVIDSLGSKVDPLELSFVQFCFTALASWAGSAIDGSIDFAGAIAGIVPVLYAGIGSVGIAYTLQVVGQAYVPPTRAALIMSLESFFSVVGGALILGETMTPRGYLGCALIFVGTLLAQTPARLPKWMRRAKAQE